ncbi:hypothetical protein NL676_029544 [Syzygium grande]|nr:hypothetical protein NL676_029544 [Syzygium grande]
MSARATSANTPLEGGYELPKGCTLVWNHVLAASALDAMDGKSWSFMPSVTSIPLPRSALSTSAGVRVEKSHFSNVASLVELDHHRRRGNIVADHSVVHNDVELGHCDSDMVVPQCYD